MKVIQKCSLRFIATPDLTKPKKWKIYMIILACLQQTLDSPAVPGSQLHWVGTSSECGPYGSLSYSLFLLHQIFSLGTPSVALVLQQTVTSQFYMLAMENSPKILKKLHTSNIMSSYLHFLHPQQTPYCPWVNLKEFHVLRKTSFKMLILKSVTIML